MIYFTEEEKTFDIKITYLNDDKLPYYVLYEIHSNNFEKENYNIELIYLDKNISIYEDSFNCIKLCEKKAEINKIFYGKYNLVISTEKYQKILEFELEKDINKNLLNIEKVYEYDEKNFLINGNLILEKESKVKIIIFPQKKEELKESFDLECFDLNCSFNLNPQKTIVFGKYDIQVYLEDDIIYNSFNIIQKAKEKDLKNLKYFENNSIQISDKIDEIKLIDLYGEERIFLLENGELKLNGVASIENENYKEGKIKSKLKSINLKKTNLSQISQNIEKRSINKEFILMGKNNLKEKEIKTKDILKESSKLYIASKDKFIDLENETSLNQDKLIPGIYKYEKIIYYKDGTQNIEENFFANGLISINTKKPLYKQNELSEFLIVVLNKWGYPVSNANISLQITKPSGDIIIFSTDYFEIYETSNKGVYSVSMISDELGEYDLYALVDLDEFIVDVSSYYNVVENYEFDILRDVPATIDPWQGPFKNEFNLIPLNDFKNKYSFTEKFSKDFEIIETDATKIEIQGDFYFLKWENLSDISKAYYIAQTPLKTPYLYYLGESYIDYSNERFYENRSWLFAIDPAARECGFESPCICGAACTGGNEAGSGTIDACSDGDTSWEFVNDIRVRALNSSYFGTGDLIEICVDFQCDSSGQGDRTTIGYKGPGGVWANSHVLQEWRCQNNLLNTFCVNTSLSNTAGIHHVRGKIAWAWNTEPANRICTNVQYRDHDDINFTVLNKVPAKYLEWDLNNASSIGNNLNLIRGENIEIYALWDKPLQSAFLNHNGSGFFTNYSINNLNENYTNYTAQTNSLSEFSHLGPIRITYISSNDFYFNLTNQTSPFKEFNLYAKLKINQSKLEPYIMYNQTSTNISCQASDFNLDIAYENVNISFYHNVTGYLGSALSNSSGWAKINYTENNTGIYTISCNLSDEISKYYLKSDENFKNQILTVKNQFADISVPIITNINANPISLSVGGLVNIRANVTDETNLDSVLINISLPDGNSFIFPMTNIYSDIFEFNFSNTIQDGIYKYYIIAYDNSSNPAWTSTRTFEVFGIRTYIGISAIKNIFKIGEYINLTLYTKTSNINSSIIEEIGDTGNIFYSFDSSDEGWTSGGTRNDWQRGFPSTGFLNTCDNGVASCFVTRLTGNYQANSDQWLQSPSINFSGRTNIKITYWRMLHIENGITTDRAFFEVWDGSTWNVLWQDTTSPSNPFTLSAGTTTVYPSDLENLENGLIRFRLRSNGNNHYQGFAIDSVNISFKARENWIKDWYYYNSAFGLENNKTSAIKIEINISDYDASASNLASTLSPDLEIQIYNGSAYSGNYSCNLDSGKSYPHICDFVIKNTPEYLLAWENENNRRIRVRAINLDGGDSIEWKDVKREIVTPSIIENHGIADVTSFLLQQFRNSSGGVEQTMYFNPVSLIPGETRQLSDYWSLVVPGGFTLGTYQAYVALTDENQNVLSNEDDGTFIEDFYEFEIRSLISIMNNPGINSIQNENFRINVSLNTTYETSGSWCAYSLNGQNNISMYQISPTYFEINVSDFKDGQYSIIAFCNDSEGYIVNTGLRYFNVSQNPRINFIPNTDLNNAYVNRSWTLFNLSLKDSSLNKINYSFEGKKFSIYDNSLKLFMPFNNIPSLGENSSDASDISYFENHGKFKGNAIFSNFGKYNSSVFFDGTNDWLEIGDSEDLDGMNEFSFEAWIYDSSLDTQPRGIIAKRVDQTSPNYAYSIFRWNNRYIYFDIASSSDRHNSGIAIDANRWIHLVVSFNGSANVNERKKFYYDGKLVSTQASSQTSIPRIVGVPTTIGILNPSYGDSWNGYIDEVKLYNRTLSDEEIYNLYHTKIIKYNQSSWNIQVNYSNLKNGPYLYQMCGTDILSNMNCTEERLININKSIPLINILSPLNNSKFFPQDLIYLNISTLIPAENSWFTYDNGLNNFSLNNLSSQNWNYSLFNLSRGGKLIKIYANDSVGNIAENSTYIFILLDKHLRISKEIISNSENNYNVTIKNSNLLVRESNMSIYDFLANNFSPNFFSQIPESNSSTLNPFLGNIFRFNNTYSANSNLTISYTILGQNNYSLSKNYIIGID